MQPQDILTVLPEVILAGYAMTALLLAVYFGKDRLSEPLFWITASVMAGIGLFLFVSPMEAREAFGGAFQDDAFARYAKGLILIGGAAMLLLSKDDLVRNNVFHFEFPILIALASVGMMMMVSAGDLIALYMGLELQSLALYVIAAFQKERQRSTEAGLKYFVLGALSSGLLLYGASLIYGYAGTTSFEGIASVVSDGSNGIGVGLLTGLVFLCVGLGFKISAAPFHMWTPDVYEGAPTAVTGYLATAAKVAAICLFARVLFDGFEGARLAWSQILSFLAMMSMYVGAIAAVGQWDIKRLMAYSSIAHMGFALMGLAAGSANGLQAMLIYMAIYLATNIGVFAFILSMRRDGQAVTNIESLGLYSRVEPLRSACLAVLMLSLAGLPPLLGFIGKFYVFFAAVDAGLLWLALAAVPASVIGAFYYLRIVYLMYFGSEVNGLDGGISRLQRLALIAAALIVVIGSVNLFGFEPYTEVAALALLD